jgi:hypothetical protein
VTNRVVPAAEPSYRAIDLAEPGDKQGSAAKTGVSNPHDLKTFDYGIWNRMRDGVTVQTDREFDSIPWHEDEEWRSLRRDIVRQNLTYAIDYLNRIPTARYSQDVTFRGTGMSHHRGNWAGMYRKLGRPRGGEVTTFAVLVPEPENKFDSFAVSIVVHGRHIGYVPRTHSEAVSRFVQRSGGLVKCIVVLWFDPRITKNSIRVHLAFPPGLEQNFRTDLSPVRWNSPRFGSQLVGFVVSR